MKRTKHRVISIKNLTPETFILRLERGQMQFEPGQYVIIRIPGERKGREYSIYSSANDPYLEFLIREIPRGEFSRYLKHVRIGTEIELEGPNGFFVLDPKNREGAPGLFIATGTGISPFHSYVRSYPDLNYKMLHGVRFADEAYGRDTFDRDRFCLCTSRIEDGDYFGRLNYYLKEHPVDQETICYLCGNSDMVDEVTDILEDYGVPAENIRTEIFF